MGSFRNLENHILDFFLSSHQISRTSVVVGLDNGHFENPRKKTFLLGKLEINDLDERIPDKNIF